MGRAFAAAVLALGIYGCEISPTSPRPIPEADTPQPNVPAADPYLSASSIEISSNSRFDIPGMRRWFGVTALDGGGRFTHSDQVVVTSSNPDVAVVRPSVYGWIPNEYLPPIRRLGGTIEEMAAGVTTITATLGTLSSSFELRVEPLPGPSTALVVDSFSVSEFSPECAWACPYVVYAPRLYLHEPTGTDEVSIEAVEVSIPSWSSGWCGGASVSLVPGAAMSVFGLDPYLWNNDMIYVDLEGRRVPAGPARARILTRDGLGTLGIVEVTGSIERNARPVYSPLGYC